MSAAIQAVSAVAVAALTYSLVRVTRKYTDLTNRIAGLNEKELSASMQPVIGIRLLNNSLGNSGRKNDEVSFQAFIENLGSQPVKLAAVTGFVVFRDGQRIREVDTAIRNAVLMPKPLAAASSNVSVFFQIDSGRTGVRFEDYEVEAGVDCTDLAGVSEHSFMVGHDKFLRHFHGFLKPRN